MAICSQQGVNFWGLKRGEDHCLPIEVAPLIECPESHTREVHIVRLTGPPVEVAEHMLEERELANNKQQWEESHCEVLPVLHKEHICLV